MAPATLRAIVVGGGITGLATALCLQEAGYTVTVLEKEENLQTRPGGIRCPPNMTRLLERWLNKLMLVDVQSNWPESLKRLLGWQVKKLGLEDCYHKCDCINVEGGESGTHTRNILLDDDLVEDLQAPFYYIPRADLLELFFALAVHETVKIFWSSEVLDLIVNSNEIEIRLTNGEKMAADLLVGADGHDSTIRNLASLADPCKETEEKYLATVYFTVPKHIMEADKELCDLVNHPTHWPVWMEKGYSMSGNVMGLHGDFSVSVIYKVDKSMLQSPLGKTIAVQSVEDLHIGVLGSIPTKLVTNAQNAFIEIVRFAPVSLERNRLVSEDGRIVLVGQAAHLLPSGGLFSTALAIDGATVLGRMQKYAHNTADVPKLLVQYEEIANKHCTTVHQCDECHTLIPSCLDSYHGEQRDTAISQRLVDGDWKRKFIDIMRLDAHESVEAWWNNWGPILQPGLVRPPIVVDVNVVVRAVRRVTNRR